jgi:hypothetical protein
LARRPCRQPDPERAPQSGRGGAPAVVPHPPTPGGVGGGLGGARSSLAMPNTPNTRETAFGCGSKSVEKMSVGVAHKIPGSLYIILGHTLRSKCPGGASGGEPGSASKSAEGARYEQAKLLTYNDMIPPSNPVRFSRA